MLRLHGPSANCVGRLKPDFDIDFAAYGVVGRKREKPGYGAGSPIPSCMPGGAGSRRRALLRLRWQRLAFALARIQILLDGAKPVANQAPDFVILRTSARDAPVGEGSLGDRLIAAEHFGASLRC